MAIVLYKNSEPIKEFKDWPSEFEVFQILWDHIPDYAQEAAYELLMTGIWPPEHRVYGLGSSYVLEDNRVRFE